jgi:uncharacterized ParB-like nuclease family protein
MYVRTYLHTSSIAVLVATHKHHVANRLASVYPGCHRVRACHSRVRFTNRAVKLYAKGTLETSTQANVSSS